MSCECRLLDKDDTYRLIRAFRQGDETARERLICANTGLVKSLALKFCAQGYEIEDLMQVGYIGLLKAIDRFDPSYDVMFSTYAVPMILGELKRYLRDDGAVKVGRQTKQDVRRMRQLSEEFCRRGGRSPKVSELSQLMGESRERILYLIEAQEAMHGPESLDNPDCGTGRQMTEGFQEDRIVDRIFLKRAIENLPERERKVLLLRYFRDMTQQQIADRMGMSQVQVSRLEKKIVKELRRELSEGL